MNLNQLIWLCLHLLQPSGSGEILPDSLPPATILTVVHSQLESLFCSVTATHYVRFLLYTFACCQGCRMDYRQLVCVRNLLYKQRRCLCRSQYTVDALEAYLLSFICILCILRKLFLITVVTYHNSLSA
jgi:hypothetical protein